MAAASIMAALLFARTRSLGLSIDPYMFCTKQSTMSDTSDIPELHSISESSNIPQGSEAEYLRMLDDAERVAGRITVMRDELENLFAEVLGLISASSDREIDGVISTVAGGCVDVRDAEAGGSMRNARVGMEGDEDAERGRRRWREGCSSKGPKIPASYTRKPAPSSNIYTRAYHGRPTTKAEPKDPTAHRPPPQPTKRGRTTVPPSQTQIPRPQLALHNFTKRLAQARRSHNEKRDPHSRPIPKRGCPPPTVDGRRPYLRTSTKAEVDFSCTLTDFLAEDDVLATSRSRPGGRWRTRDAGVVDSRYDADRLTGGKGRLCWKSGFTHWHPSEIAMRARPHSMTSTKARPPSERRPWSWGIASTVVTDNLTDKSPPLAHPGNPKEYCINSYFPQTAEGPLNQEVKNLGRGAHDPTTHSTYPQVLQTDVPDSLDAKPIIATCSAVWYKPREFAHLQKGSNVASGGNSKDEPLTHGLPEGYRRFSLLCCETFPQLQRRLQLLGMAEIVFIRCQGVSVG
ncbi:uncharacterized protein EV422DRAFT_603131 [Fimicolochytrium jonesii]|uniref:uncharacterized protein n=1 Tax=Fimicolochytrium jonesii TaxID=1396493 RepID=UPI0022FE1939|nr:uncharacterized protein EV422DRAFT_603131 [Fimicolochytrium jonesii]KAI8817907.1 hypothetical protein EV422DRAFT_603131 [Fimicolochytrium jonesii]